MKIPNKIKIGAVTYKVVYPHTFAPNDNACGRICYAEDTIKIDPLNGNGVLYSPTRVWQTLLHEIIHAANDVMNAGLNEENVERMAQIALAILIDNGWLVPELPGKEANPLGIFSGRVTKEPC